MKTKTLAYACLACAAASTSVAAAPCYSDGDVVTLAGTVLRKNAPAAAAQNVLVLSLAAPICVAGTPNARSAQATVKELQIVGSTPDPDTTVQLTGKLVTGNVSGFYSVPTAIWVLRSRPLTSR